MGARGAGVSNYLDKQLAGAWGAGERLYRSGPWTPGSASQGYQLPFTPGELFHQALRAINRDLNSCGTHFSTMTAEAQDAYLKTLEGCNADLNGVPSGVFFGMLLQMTVGGFFSAPVYGGNRDMVAWRMTDRACRSECPAVGKGLSGLSWRAWRRQCARRHPASSRPVRGVSEQKDYAGGDRANRSCKISQNR